jgi:ribose transport system substrate-binding protein
LSLVSFAALAVAALAVAAAQGSRAGKPTIAFVSADLADPFFITQHCGASKAAKQFGANLTWQGVTSFDYKQEVTVFNAVLTKKPQAIIVVPFSGTAFVQPVKEALKQGILVVANNAPLAQANLATRTYITAEAKLGGLAGDGLARQLGGKGEVALIAPETGLFTFDQRMKGFKQAIARHPGMKLVATEYSGGDAGKAAQKMGAILQAHPNLAGVFTVDTTDGEGAASGIVAADARGKVKLISYDASPKEVSELKQGVLQGLVAQDPYSYGYEVVKFLAQALNGKIDPKKGPRTVTFGGAFIDKSNVGSAKIKRYLYRGSC